MVLLQTWSVSHRKFCKDGNMFWAGKKDSCFYVFNTFDRCALWQILWIIFTGHNRLSQSPLLLVSGSGSSLSLCQQKHKKFLDFELDLRTKYLTCYSTVACLLRWAIREILYDSVLNPTEKIWKYPDVSFVAALKLVVCGPSATSCFRATRKS